MPLSYTDVYDIDEEASNSHGLTVGGKLMDSEKYKFWQDFHSRRKAALKIADKGDYSMLRLFIAECETLGMPASARACMAIMRGATT